MLKNYFHNTQHKNENKVKNKTIQTYKIDKKRVVDVNILLNRVKIEKKNETKRQIIFFSIVILALSLFGAFIAIIN